MMVRFDKIQEPTKCQQKKALKFDEGKPKRKRGGKKYRKMRERLGLTEVRTLQNRMLMDPGNGQIEDEETGEGFGMLGQASSGKLRVDKKKQKMNMSRPR
jgi:U4/U6 small nuclear ribonucleoprotein PRP31